MQTAITFRIPMKLKNQASKVAKKMGIPLTLVLKNALKDFTQNPKIVLTENGFTPKFEEEILQSSKIQTRGMSKKDFLKSLEA